MQLFLAAWIATLVVLVCSSDSFAQVQGDATPNTVSPTLAQVAPALQGAT